MNAPLDSLTHILLQHAGWFMLSYLVGSIPVAWLLTKWHTGRDLRQIGSGNVGVMNTAISTHRWAGLLVFITEIAKGALAVVLPRLYGAPETAVCLSVVAVVMGTHWPIWLRFHGGRANTTSMAALFFISWNAFVVMVAVWVLARLLAQQSFQASRFTILAMPILIALVTHSWSYTLASIVLLGIYLTAQQPGTDDHLLIQGRWSSFWNFLTSPPRGG